jgi:hypothetical protein
MKPGGNPLTDVELLDGPWREIDLFDGRLQWFDTHELVALVGHYIVMDSGLGPT